MNILVVRLGAMEDVQLLEPIEEIARTGRTRSDEIRELAEHHAGDPHALARALELKLPSSA